MAANGEGGVQPYVGVARHTEPLLTVQDVPASAEDLEVVGVFNPGACRFGDETLLLLRVAERPRPEPGWTKVLTADAEKPGTLRIQHFREGDGHRIEEADPRHLRIDGQRYLSSLSHLRLARSRNGRNFVVSPQPTLVPTGPLESYGIEDARISRIGSRYLVTYTAVSPDSFGVCITSTDDFLHWQPHGMGLPPENKDACILPDMVRDAFVMLHRPSVSFLGQPSIWSATSPDLQHWGNHRCLLRPADAGWQKIGAGPEPLLTKDGWLLLYHACDDQNRYSLHLALLDHDDASRVIALSPPETPLLAAELAWERQGFVPEVVFCNGWVLDDAGCVHIYYGAADESVGVASAPLDALLATLRPRPSKKTS